MQKIAAFLLERRDNLQWAAARTAEGAQLCSTIEAWLAEKGASLAAPTGAYVAEDGSDARFDVLRANDGDRSWVMYQLAEVTREGRRFMASISVTIADQRVVVFVTLEVGSVSTQVNQFDVDPRCPKVVRALLGHEGGWYHGESRLRGLNRVVGFDAGETLALEIQHERRTIPFVVVSTVDGKAALDALDDKLAYDLAGIANVCTVDDAAAWALTDTLRKPFSCYSGAVRVYWPGFRSDESPFRHPLWTAARLTSLDGDPRQARDRFRRQMRALIMLASAAGVVRPREIDEIRSAAARAEFAAVKARAKSLEDFQMLADSYAADNDALRKDLLRTREDVAQLQTAIARLESEKDGLAFHLRQARAGAVPEPQGDELEPDLSEDEAREVGPPTAGEVRFYKKRYAAPTHDVMVRVGDCGHGAWQGAGKADKAKKGIAKLEGSRQDWEAVHHCGTCTGGGMWRVQW